MGESTGISWTDHTFNPWWGCAKVSAECTNCYAEALDHRYGGEHWGVNAPRRFFGAEHWRNPHKWDAAAARDGVRRRVFCASMADVFEERADLVDERGKLWNLIANTPNLDWLLLTKRPENAALMVPWIGNYMNMTAPPGTPMYEDPWPNVWLGVTGGTSDTLRDRVFKLRAIPAAIRFVSCEPLLEHIPSGVWDQALTRRRSASEQPTAPEHTFGPIHWLIVGDESGSRRRPAQVDWVRTAREAALRHGVAFHFKQWCGATGGGIANHGEVAGRKIHLPILDGKQWAEFPL